MTWQQISDEVNRKLVLAATPRVSVPEMVGLLNESYEELLSEWYPLTFERDEMAIQMLSPLKRGPIAPTPAASFLIDTTLFPGGLRLITSLRGKFLQTCSQVEEWRNITFLADNDISDLDNPLRAPTNDFPKYREYWSTADSKKKVVIHSEVAPTAIEVYYFMNQAVIASVSTGTPEIDVTGHYKIVKRAVKKQSGIDEDVRTPVFADETNKDLQISTI